MHVLDDAPIHVSLSRTVVLHHHQIGAFVASCGKSLSQQKAYATLYAQNGAYSDHFLQIRLVYTSIDYSSLTYKLSTSC